jgi:hypothetical protein
LCIFSSCLGIGTIGTSITNIDGKYFRHTKHVGI